MVRGPGGYSTPLWQTPVYPTRLSLEPWNIVIHETMLRESKLPKQITWYSVVSLISDFGDWMIPFIQTVYTEGSSTLCGYGIE